MSNELHKAIEQLYRIFAKYPANPVMDGSPLYQELREWNLALMAKPLRELSAETDLRIYYFKALSTWGDVTDFKHFLPRILELLTTLPHDFVEWVALDKLNYSNWQTWPAPEQKAIQCFLEAFWQILLTKESTQIDALFEDYFPAIADVYPNFNQLLLLWSETDSQQAAQRLASFVCRHAKQIIQKQLLPGHCKSAVRGKLFLDWLGSSSALAMLKRATSSEAEYYLDVEIAPIIQQLEQR